MRAVGMVGAMAFAGALALRIVEPQATPDFESAIWWSVVTLSTVGYGDISPVTTEGRLVAMALMVSGLGVFGFVTGFVTSLMQDPEEDEVLRRIRNVERMLERLAAAHGHEGAPPSAR